MDWTIANDAMPAEVGVEENGPPSGVLGRVEVPVCAAEVTLSSGRRYEIAARPDGDRISVRGRGGAVLLEVLMTDRGPVLAFDSAEIEISAARRLALSAEDIDLTAHGSLAVRAGGDCTQAIGGTRRTHIAGADRLEAGSVQLQASDGAVELRAAGRVALDGEHIGLNDDPCPQPFEWSALARALEGDER